MRRTLLFSLIAIALLVAACSPKTVGVKETVVVQGMPEVKKVKVTIEVVKEVKVEVLALPEVDPLSVTGDIVTAGSSTVFPLSERMAERFQDEGYAGNITIDSIGSGAGFERFCVEGETDISNASRGIKDSEIESCKSVGRDPIEFRVGTDALAIVVSKDNDFIVEATMEELAAIFSTATTWADVNPDWPAPSPSVTSWWTSCTSRSIAS